MSLLSNLTSADKELLKLTPFWVFYLVSKADGKIDAKEMKQFKDELADFTTKLFKDPEFAHQRAESEISISIFESVNANFGLLENTVTKYSDDYLANLTKIGDVVDAQFNRHEAQLFKQILINLAVSIADSSGGWKFLKNNISKLEAQVIVDIKKAIKYRDTFKIDS